MNYISGLAHLVTNTKMAVTLAHFTSFFQNKAKSIKRGENHYKSEHVESCTYDKGELDGSVRASMRDRLYKVSVSNTSVMCNVNDITNATLGFVVFLVAYFS